MRKISFTFLLLLFLCAVVAEAVVNIPPPTQATHDKTTTGSIPDLDQNRDYVPPSPAAETAWCAPTASADSVWYYATGTYPLLMPAGATNIIKADCLDYFSGRTNGYR